MKTLTAGSRLGPYEFLAPLGDGPSEQHNDEETGFVSRPLVVAIE
jgi:hypothetical protein